MYFLPKSCPIGLILCEFYSSEMNIPFKISQNCIHYAVMCAIHSESFDCMYSIYLRAHIDHFLYIVYSSIPVQAQLLVPVYPVPSLGGLPRDLAVFARSCPLLP